MKILIIGSVASGKTTLARKLSKEINIPYYEIDSIVHDDLHKRKRTINEQKQIINSINKNDSWIIEGTLRKQLDFLLEYADKIIFIDIPISIRKRKVVTRFIKQKLKLEKSAYQPNINILKDMFKWTREFEENRKTFENKLSKYSYKLIILKQVNNNTLQELNLF